MKKKFIAVVLLLIAIIATIGIIWVIGVKAKNWSILSPLGSKVKEEKKELPLEKYEFKKLKERSGKASEIKLERILQKTDDFTSYIFSYTSEERKITGLVNIPFGLEKFPVIVMLRGYVDPEIYEIGVGTQRAGEVFAQNSYITLAPDFLGYGESDMPPDNVWEERFLRAVGIQDLLASLCRQPTDQATGFNVDSNRIGIWGHSNGGMSALTALELSGKEYPTSLWAPVSKYFPYDILYYTDEFEDRGKALRKSLAEFEKDYEVEKYSFDNYLDWIRAPILLHQGTTDPYIPISWPNSLVEKLEKLEKDIVYYTYPGSDHNMEGNWDLVMQRDLKFFQDRLE